MLVEGTHPPGKRVDGHGRREIGGVKQFLQPGSRQNASRQHLRSAIVQGQAFLVREPYRCQPGAPQRLGTGQSLAPVERLAAAQQHDCQVRQRRQVAAGSDRTFLRHHRCDACIEHRHLRLEGADADSGVTTHQGVDSNHQHCPHHLRWKRLADADCVGNDQVALQLLEQGFSFGLGSGHARAQAVGAEQLVGVAAEAGRYAIDWLLPSYLFDQEVRCPLHFVQLRRIKFNAGAVGDRNDLFAGQGLSIEAYRFHLSDPASHVAVRARP